MAREIVLKEIIGFAVCPNISKEEILEIIANLRRGNKIGFIDLAPSNEIMSLMRQIEDAGCEIGAFFDHHLDVFAKNKAEVRNGAEIERKLGNRSRVLTRKCASSSAHLVALGEWRKFGVNIVFFHADADGFFGFLKGCGVSYPEMDSDADILDGVAKGRKLTSAGKLLADCLQYLVPAFSQNPEGHRIWKENIFREFGGWVADGCLPDDKRIIGLRQRADEAAEEAIDIAMKLVAIAKKIPGDVVVSDFLPYIKAGKSIAIPLWKSGILRKFGSVLICSTGSGHMGEQMFIELPRAWQGKYDLRDFLPNGVRGRAPFRAQVPLNRWEEFLQNWRKRKK